MSTAEKYFLGRERDGLCRFASDPTYPVRKAVDRLPERLQEPLWHVGEPGVKRKQLEPLPERPATVVLSSQVFELSATFLINARPYSRQPSLSSRAGTPRAVPTISPPRGSFNPPSIICGVMSVDLPSGSPRLAQVLVSLAAGDLRRAE